jgi:hypothetical protein
LSPDIVINLGEDLAVISIFMIDEPIKKFETTVIAKIVQVPAKM